VEALVGSSPKYLPNSTAMVVGGTILQMNKQSMVAHCCDIMEEVFWSKREVPEKFIDKTGE
jgi:hypothetical protein